MSNCIASTLPYLCPGILDLASYLYVLSTLPKNLFILCYRVLFLHIRLSLTHVVLYFVYCFLIMSVICRVLVVEIICHDSVIFDIYL